MTNDDLHEDDEFVEPGTIGVGMGGSCPVCRAPVDLGQEFCLECGSPIRFTPRQRDIVACPGGHIAAALAAFAERATDGRVKLRARLSHLCPSGLAARLGGLYFGKACHCGSNRVTERLGCARGCDGKARARQGGQNEEGRLTQSA